MALFTISTPAVMISARPLGESDLLINLFTLESGKLRAVAKGAKRSRKRFMNALEPFTEISARLVRSRSAAMWRLESAVILDSHEAVRTDYARFIYGSLCLELTDMWQKEGIREKTVFQLLKWYLAGLSGSAVPLNISLIFKTRLLKAAGFLPSLSVCKVCGKTAERGPVAFDRTTGEIFCRACGNAKKTGRLCLGTARSIDFISRTDLKSVSRLKFVRAQAEEGWFYLKNLHCRHLQKEPSSYKFIDLKNTRGVHA